MKQITVFEKIPLQQAFSESDLVFEDAMSPNQLNAFPA